jgi:response regulator RpfG family c-di-GMP phosphodiesterase
MNVNFGATLDPYAIDNSGSRINIYNINNGGSLFRMTSANLTMNYSISSRENGKTKKKTQTNKVKEMVVVTMTLWCKHYFK